MFQADISQQSENDIDSTATEDDGSESADSTEDDGDAVSVES